MVGISLAFVMSYLCLERFSVVCRDGPARAVDGEVSTPLDDEAWTPVDIPLSDITLLVLKLESTSLIDSSATLSSLNM
jgi:hypothetical protein